jgi:uncharacterized protein
MNRYLDERDEADGLPVLPFFMAVRALIRAHVCATQSEQAQAGLRDQLSQGARKYFDLSAQLLAPVPTRLIAIGGLSGTGKSTLAASVAEHFGPPPGARVLSSDRLRKRLHGVPAETRLEQEAYGSDVSGRVYSTLFKEAQTILSKGHTVIVDAVFDRTADRQKIKQYAMETGVPFTALWLEAPLDLLIERVGKRQGDPSDATADVVCAQAARQYGSIDWIKVFVSDNLSNVIARVINILNTVVV